MSDLLTLVRRRWELARQIDSARDQLREIDEAICAGLDYLGRRSANVEGWVVEIPAPNRTTYDPVILRERLEAIAGDVLDPQKIDATCPYKREATVNRTEVRALATHPDPDVRAAIESARIVLPQARYARVRPPLRVIE